MCDPQIVMIHRARRFSPNSVEKDARILRTVCDVLSGAGHDVVVCDEEDKELLLPAVKVYVTMGRSESLLRQLEARQASGAIVVNSVAGVRLCCQRSRQMQMLEAMQVCVAPREGDDGYWVKRGDASAQTPEDVVYQSDRAGALEAAERMKVRGAKMVDVRAHVKGDLVKFYGVCGTPFFRCYYPGDDGQSKFGDERRNGCPHHYAFDMQQLKRDMDYAASVLQVDVYGGDCIVRPDGSAVLIDFNDWPSFSRCREEAAEAIASHILARIEDKKK